MKNIYQLIILMTISSMALADGNVMPMKVPEKVKSECASCHMVYPPAFLPKESWTRIMGGLEKHYGTDASVDAATERQIGVWLQSLGGTYKRVEASSPADRLTTTQWFEKKHRKIDKAVWTRKSVNGKAQCQACHQGADIGNFEDDGVRIPL